MISGSLGIHFHGICCPGGGLEILRSSQILRPSQILNTCKVGGECELGGPWARITTIPGPLKSIRGLEIQKGSLAIEKREHRTHDALPSVPRSLVDPLKRVWRIRLLQPSDSFSSNR